MEIQIPLILFTTFLAWSAGLFATQAIYAMRGKGASTQMMAVIASIILIAIGGIAVLFHLQHALRIFNGFGNLTSGITQELIAIVVLVIFMIIYFIMLCRNNNGTVPQWLSICAIVFGVVLLAVCAHSYMMPSRPAWNSIFQIGSLLGAAAGLGPGTMALMCSCTKFQTKFNNFVHKVIKTYTVGIDLSANTTAGKADGKDADGAVAEAASVESAGAEGANAADGSAEGADKDGEHPAGAAGGSFGGSGSGFGGSSDGSSADGDDAKDAAAESTDAEKADGESVKETQVQPAKLAKGTDDVKELNGKANFIGQIANAALSAVYLIAMTVSAGAFTQVGYYFDPTGPTRGIIDSIEYTPWSLGALPATFITIVFLAASVVAAVMGKKTGDWKKWGAIIVIAAFIATFAMRVLFYILGGSVYPFTDLEV